MATLYKETLRAIMNTIVFDSNIMQSDIWGQLTPLITQEVLDDAHETSDKEKISHLGNSVFSRTVKQMARIEIKKTKNNDFKLNSDFEAFFIEIENVKNISKIITELKQIFPVFFQRNEIIENGKVTDIVAFCFAYDGEYLIEFQIGHPFARYTFSRDSYMREHKNENIQVDLWDRGFYNHVKNVILKNEENRILPRLLELYSKSKIERELLDIVRNIE